MTIDDKLDMEDILDQDFDVGIPGTRGSLPPELKAQILAAIRQLIREARIEEHKVIFNILGEVLTKHNRTIPDEAGERLSARLRELEGDK